MCKWVSQHDDAYSCSVPPEEGSEECILHAGGNKDVAKFAAQLEFQMREIGEPAERNPQYSFRGYVFPTGIAIRTPGGGQTLGGLLLECDARPNLLFDEAVIQGDVNCIQARIRTLCFSHARIEGIAMFLEATVEGLADFRGTRFVHGATFASARLGDAHFESASFEGQSYFEECEARNLFLGPNRPTIFPLARNREGVAVSALSGASFWRFARRYFEKYGHREKADAAFYFERLWRFRKRIAAGGSERAIAYVVGVSDFVCLRVTTAYGASVSRVVGSWLAVIGGFGAVYAAVPSLLTRPSYPVWSLSNWLTALYTSVGVFTMQGPSDAAPTRMLGKMLTSLEAVIGGILMALLIGVVTRKFMR